MNTDCTRANKSQVRKTTKYLVKSYFLFLVKYLFNRYLYISCKIYSTSQKTLMLSIYHSLYVVFVKWRWTIKCHIQLAIGKAHDGTYIATGFSVCPSGLLPYQTPFWSEIVFCAVWRELEGSDGRNWMLGARIVSLEPLRQLLCIVCASHLD